MEDRYVDPDYELWFSALLACLEDLGASSYNAAEARQLFEDGVPPGDAAVALMS